MQAVDAFGGEVLCTFLLVLTVFAATDGEMSRKHGHISALLPFAIGMAVLLGGCWLIIFFRTCVIQEAQAGVWIHSFDLPAFHKYNQAQ